MSFELSEARIVWKIEHGLFNLMHIPSESVRMNLHCSSILETMVLQTNSITRARKSIEVSNHQATKLEKDEVLLQLHIGLSCSSHLTQAKLRPKARAMSIAKSYTYPSTIPCALALQVSVQQTHETQAMG
jgi:cystathionine beta-lyase family protein involved in aluminum resistance